VDVRFSAPIQTSPGSNPASSAVGTGSLYQEKQLGCGIDYPSPSSTKGKNSNAAKMA